MKRSPKPFHAFGTGILLAGAVIVTAGDAAAQERPFLDQNYVQWADFDDDTGFISMFNGVSLAPAAGEEGFPAHQRWDGDPDHWRVENGVIVGQSTEQTPVDNGNTFLIWRGGHPADFELKVEFRFAQEAGNSGVQYRSYMRENGSNPWALGGYQADMNFENQHTGMLYEEGGRGRLSVRGMTTIIDHDGNHQLIGAIGTQAGLGELINPSEWNRLHIIAIGSTMVHIINDQVMSVVIDNEAGARQGSGLIGFQMHTGPPMRIEFRNPRIKYH